MSHVLDRLHQKLVHVLVEWDKADARREAKRGHVNIYRLSHLLGAAQRAQEEAEAEGGSTEAYRDAVMHHFNPSARIKTFLKKNVDATVDVDRGFWTTGGKRAF